jgi:hypothetical protein
MDATKTSACSFYLKWGSGFDIALRLLRSFFAPTTFFNEKNQQSLTADFLAFRFL